MATTRDEIIAVIALETGCSNAVAERAYDGVINTVIKGIAEDGEAVMRGLGSFTRKATAARQGRNPRTGVPIDLPAGFRVKFNPGKALRDRIAA